MEITYREEIAVLYLQLLLNQGWQYKDALPRACSVFMPKKAVSYNRLDEVYQFVPKLRGFDEKVAHAKRDVVLYELLDRFVSAFWHYHEVNRKVYSTAPRRKLVFIPVSTNKEFICLYARNLQNYTRDPVAVIDPDNTYIYAVKGNNTTDLGLPRGSILYDYPRVAAEIAAKLVMMDAGLNNYYEGDDNENFN